MFKLGSFEEEIAKSMADNLVAKRIERSKEVVKTADLVKETKFRRAIEHIEEAVDLLKSAGFVDNYAVASKLLKKIANKKDDEPEVLEFKSILFDEDEDEDKETSEEDLGDQIIEFKSIADKKKV